MTMTTSRRPHLRRRFAGTEPDEDPESFRGRAMIAGVSLPTGRAIVGGLLVAVSGLGILAAHRAATLPDRTEWLVVRRPIAAGATIAADDLALAPMTLATGSRSRAVDDPADVIGRIALVPLAPGDLVLRSTTATTGDATAPGRRVGLALGAADALGGALEVGDRVDVVSVPPPDGASEVIVRGALVSAVDDGSEGGVGAVDDVRLILEVPDEAAAKRVIDAHADAGVTLIAASTVSLER